MPFPCNDEGWSARGRTPHGTSQNAYPADFNRSNDLGDPVVASAAGTATFTGDTYNTVEVNHGGGWSTYYRHMTPAFKAGTEIDVAQGALLGTVDGWGKKDGVKTRDAYSPHLHYEQLQDNSVVQIYFDGASIGDLVGRVIDMPPSKNCGGGGGGQARADFNGDGRADIATFYDYGNGARIHPFISTGSSFSYNWLGWWSTDSGYALENVGGRMVAGDFNGDGRADVATFYDYGAGARIHVFVSTGSSFAYNSHGWWATESGYALEAVGGRMVAGDFNGDGKDDIATFYDYGAGARIHVFVSTGSSFTYNYRGWWATETGYALEQVGDRMVAGDFNGDGRDDIATFYDYGEGARVHPFISTGSSFSYNWLGWWSTESGYDLDLVGGRMVAGDFNGDGRDDIATFYDYGEGARVHPFISTGSSFAYNYRGWWATETGYALEQVGDRMVAGDFNGDGRDDIATFYDYGEGARVHPFISTGSSFSYNWLGWWSTDSGYSLEDVAGRMVGTG